MWRPRSPTRSMMMCMVGDLPTPSTRVGVPVPPGDDRLEGQLAGDGLQDGEVGAARRRRAPSLVDVDEHVGHDVLGPGRAVRETPGGAAVERRVRLLDRDRIAESLEGQGGVGEELADAGEVAEVDELGVGVDELGDGLGRRLVHGCDCGTDHWPRRRPMTPASRLGGRACPRCGRPASWSTARR